MERIGFEIANFGIAAHHEAEYRRLYPAYRKHAIVAGLVQQLFEQKQIDKPILWMYSPMWL